jgi:hypothetical protein
LTGLRSETSENDEVKPDMEKGLEEVAAKQDRVLGAEEETKTEAKTNL